MKLKSITRNLFYTLFSIAFFSCTATKNMYYVKDLASETTTLQKNNVSKINVGDRVSIVVSCADPSQTSFLNPFNNQNPGVSGTQGGGIGYLVDSVGNIDFPLIGKVQMQNLTSEEASKKIKEGLKTFFKDPYVYVNLMGKVFVINGRGGYNVSITNERLTIFEALTQQGSYEPDDLWNEVLVIREREGKRTANYIDLTSKEVLNSPYYYLQSNDLVYVKPGKLNATLRSTGAVRSTIGLVSGVLAIVLLLIKK